MHRLYRGSSAKAAAWTAWDEPAAALGGGGTDDMFIYSCLAGAFNDSSAFSSVIIVLYAR